MTSSPQDRLDLISAAYQAAYARQADDLGQAASPEQAQAVLANVGALEIAYLDAAEAALDATGPDIEAAYEAASAANDEVERAYADAVALADRIRAVAGAVTAVGDLLTKAKGA
jgi:hypothetical protein